MAVKALTLSTTRAEEDCAIRQQNANTLNARGASHVLLHVGGLDAHEEVCEQPRVRKADPIQVRAARQQHLENPAIVAIGSHSMISNDMHVCGLMRCHGTRLQ